MNFYSLLLQIENQLLSLNRKGLKYINIGAIPDIELKSLIDSLEKIFSIEKNSNGSHKKTYLKPKYISPCHAGSLFGVITASGDVFPCEILEDKLIGNLRDYGMNFSDLWRSQKKEEIKNFILDNKCNCTYECALSYNVLSNWRYQPSLVKSVLKK